MIEGQQTATAPVPRRVTWKGAVMVVLGVLLVAFYTFGSIFLAPTYSDLVRECRASCKSTSGRLVKRDVPYSSKPSNNHYDCQCQ